jgi:hypothetical protein
LHRLHIQPQCWVLPSLLFLDFCDIAAPHSMNTSCVHLLVEGTICPVSGYKALQFLLYNQKRLSAVPCTLLTPFHCSLPQQSLNWLR